MKNSLFDIPNVAVGQTDIKIGGKDLDLKYHI